MNNIRTEEYLEAIFKLEQSPSPVSTSKLSKELKLSAASVSEMLKKFEDKGLIKNKAKKGYLLTKEGNKIAKQVVRRHRLSERFLTDVLGIPWDKVHDEACKLEHALGIEVEEKLATMLGNPETCPHGHPIPSKDGHIPEYEAVELSSLKAGVEAIIVRIAEENSKMLNYLTTLGLLPKTRLKILEVAPFGGPLMIRVGRSKYALGREVAKKILVEEKK